MTNNPTVNKTENRDYLIPEMAPELLRGPRWLRDVRRRSREAFNSAPVPHRGLHLWRYTDPTTFLVDRSQVIDTDYGENFGAVEKIVREHVEHGNLAGVVTDLAGREIGFHGTEELCARGAIVTKLSEAAAEHPELVEEYLYRLVNSACGKFEALNGALWNDGIFIYIPDGLVIEKPLHLLRESGLSGSAQYPRLLVIVGKNAELSIIDEYGGGSLEESQPSNTNSAVEIFGLADSRVRYVSLQRQASGLHGYMTHRALIEQGPSSKYHSIRYKTSSTSTSPSQSTSPRCMNGIGPGPMPFTKQARCIMSARSVSPSLLTSLRPKPTHLLASLPRATISAEDPPVIPCRPNWTTANS